MKILFLSDIHGISDNLKYIKKLDDKENFDKIVVLGDLYYAGPTFDNSKQINSLEVKDFLTGYQERLICIKGNCDSDVDIKASDFPICSQISLICVDGLDIYLTHGNEYNIKKDRKFQRKGILVYGHEHYSYIEKKNDMLFINVGSISLPKKDSEASYCIYENKTFIIYGISGKVIEKVSF
ncbi:MAG: phosphodiesterase [Bacilli bacterium]|nr:phosphodiesterase [Bacilli bacterium]MDD4796049.1 phosphodiesterase [Bacilli bacterium]